MDDDFALFDKALDNLVKKNNIIIDNSNENDILNSTQSLTQNENDTLEFVREGSVRGDLSQASLTRGDTQYLQQENCNCIHENTMVDNGVTHCMDCGEEVSRDISQDKEWRFYGHGDSVHCSDPNRCQIRKKEERNIYKDVEGKGFSQKIINTANNIYSEVTKKKKKNKDDPDVYQIYRGTSRKAIVFACIFSAYKLHGMPETWEELSKVFKLDRKDCSTGIKHISKFAPKKSPLRTTYITPIDLVDSIMDKFDATKQQKLEVINIYKQIENSSYKLNQSRPKSVACSLVYFWIKKTGKDMSIKDFTDNVQLSEITVDKLSKEIERVIEEKKNKLKRILQVANEKELEIKNKNFVEKNHITPIEDIINNSKDDESIDKLIDSHTNFKDSHIRKDITKQKNDKLKKIQTTKPRKHKN